MTLSVRPLSAAWTRIDYELALTPALRRLITGGLVGLALTAIFVQLSIIWIPTEVGLDFSPLRDAATAMLHGRSVYTDPLFVYPPTAAVPMVAFAGGSAATAFRVWVMVGIAALISTAIMLARLRPPRIQLPLAAVGTVVLVGGAVAFDSLMLGNMSPVLVPFAVYALLCFERGRWTRGCAVLVVSLLLKPLLAPLFLLPVVRQQWRALGLSLGPGAAVLALACALIPGAGKLSRVAGFVLGGTNLHGENAVNNLSWSGVGEYSHHPAPAAVAAVLVAVVGVAGLVLWTRYGEDGSGSARIGTAVLLTVFLAGRISEVHFLLVIIATVLLTLSLRPSRSAALAMVPGLAVLELPHSVFLGLAHPGGRLQGAYVVAELALLLACLWPQLSDACRRRPAGRAAAVGQPAPAS